MITKYIKVTSVTFYALDYNSRQDILEDITMINGWPYEKVKEDWFKTFPLSMSHATRDSNHIGNTTELINIELVDHIKPPTEFIHFEPVKSDETLEEAIKSFKEETNDTKRS